MDTSKTQLERAFELAGSGRCDTVSDIRKALSAEGYSTDQLTGSTLFRQLRTLIADAKAKTDA
jgi:hypothetical protein